MTVVCRGVRGATTIEKDTPEEILTATGELLKTILEANEIHFEDIGSVIFTTTPDVTSEYPAVAARKLPGWSDMALLCSHEMAVPHGLKKCIRVLLHWNTEKTISEIKHIYIKGAVTLRPDIVSLQKTNNKPGQADRGNSGKPCQSV